MLRSQTGITRSRCFFDERVVFLRGVVDFLGLVRPFCATIISNKWNGN